MPLWFVPALLAGSAIATTVAGIWLLLHLTALARTVARNADVGAAPLPARASRRAVRAALTVFCAGLLVTLALLIVSIGGLANA